MVTTVMVEREQKVGQIRVTWDKACTFKVSLPSTTGCSSHRTGQKLACSLSASNPCISPCFATKLLRTAQGSQGYN